MNYIKLVENMCRVSDKLKLCSCVSDISSLKHYWIFYRFGNETGISVIGEAIMPYHISPQTDNFNKDILVTLLNEKETFDTDLKSRENDRLEISFMVTSESENRLNYSFKFKSGSWISEEYKPFLLMESFTEEKYGKIKNPFQR